MKSFDSATFAIVDVETTGTSPTSDRIIEIGILRVENGVVVESFESLVNPEKYVPPSIEAITGIRAEELLTAPTFSDLEERITELLAGAVFVAHNARFDYGFIKNEFKREGTNFSAKCLCTVRLSRKMFPTEKRHDLTTIIGRFGFECERRHRAFDDAAVLWDFLTHLHTERPEELVEAICAITSGNTLPQFLDEKSVKKLPEVPGVNIIYGEHDEVLYVGKSKSIRTRVLSHFAADHATTKEMHLCQEVRRIEALPTAGELSALLKESELVKELSPHYNRALRRRAELVVARKHMRAGYSHVTLERLNTIEPDEYKDILAIFKTVRQAKSYLSSTVKEDGLCGKLLGLESGSGACFYSQIGKCKGACAKREPIEDYNARVLEVFKKRKLKVWPISSAIVIEEKGSDGTHSFILDNWCLVGDVYADDDTTEYHEHTPNFDYDAYKIFVRYLKDPLNRKRIKRLTPGEFAKLSNMEERVIA